MKYRFVFRLAALMLALLLPLAWASAQSGSPITAQVDRSTISTDQQLTLSVIIDIGAVSGPMPELQAPPLDGFEVAGSSMATQMSIVNGVQSARMIYTFALQPTRADTLTIPPYSINVNGQQYSSDPITVQVTQGGQPQAQTQPQSLPQPQAQPQSSLPAQQATSATADGQLAVAAVVDNPTPYVGQQVRFSFRFYQAVTLFGQPEYTPPSFTGFFASDREPEQSSYLENGYNVSELTTYLFPTAAGEATIDPASLLIPSGLSSITLQTQPVIVNVKPLPDGAPADFQGAVGQFDIAANASTTAINNSSESVTLRVTVSGAGNLEALPDLVWPAMPEWRVFDSDSATNAAISNGQIAGTTTYERVLVPTAAGDLTIPSISFSYFDPQSQQYVTESTSPIVITVAPGAAEIPAPPQQATVPAGQPQPTPQPQAAVPAVIHDIKPVPGTLISTPNILVEQPLFWLMVAVPLVMLAAEWFWARRERHLRENAELIRSSQAHKRARQELRRARKQTGDAYTKAERIFTGYLADKVHQPVVGLTRSALARLLESHGVRSDLVQRVDSFLLTMEASQYSPQKRKPDASVFEETERLITDLERNIAV